MLALFQIAALCVALDETPGYTVHIRALTSPERAVHMPLAGSRTVLDAVEALQMQPGDLGQMDLWVVRRAGDGRIQVLPVDWAAITQRGATATNSQLLAGDRLFLQTRPAK